MKMKKEHYDYLSEKINHVLSVFLKVSLEKLETVYRDDGLTPMRLRWDLLWKAGIKIGRSRNGDEFPVYDYLNDDHIDTALRRIMKEVGLSWAATK